MNTYDLNVLASSFEAMDFSKSPSKEEAAAAVRSLGALSHYGVGLMRFSGQTPWVKHTGEELIYVLEGFFEITLLTETDPTRVSLKAGSLFILPRDIWHRSLAIDSVTLLFATPFEGNASSIEDDPRILTSIDNKR